MAGNRIFLILCLEHQNRLIPKQTFGVMKEDEVNIIVVTDMTQVFLEMIVEYAEDLEMLETCKRSRAKGINAAGVCVALK